MHRSRLQDLCIGKCVLQRLFTSTSSLKLNVHDMDMAALLREPQAMFDRQLMFVSKQASVRFPAAAFADVLSPL